MFPLGDKSVDYKQMIVKRGTGYHVHMINLNFIPYYIFQ